MKSFDLVIREGLVVTGDDVRPADVAVSGASVAALLEPNSGAEARVVVRAAGRFLLPGLIDAHVHFGTPGLSNQENWRAGSRAAAAGGVTTVIDMPDLIRGPATARDLRDKHRAVAGTSLVDYRTHLGVAPDVILDPGRWRGVSEAAHAQVASVRVPLTADPRSLDAFFARAAECGLRVLVHAHDPAVSALLDSWFGAPVVPADYERHLPRTAAIVGVSRLIELVRRHGGPIHVLHVSSREEADLLTAAAMAGLPMSFEVSGHHLSFTSADIKRQDTRLWVTPPIRDQADQASLWAAAIDRDAAIIVSDHDPHRLADKQLSGGQAPAGAPGVQELLPALFTGLRRDRGLDARTAAQIMVRALAERPARMFDLAGRKGRIAVGLDADLVVFDPDRLATLSPHEVYAQCGWSAYEGWSFAGRVELTVRRGEIVYDRRGGDVRFGSPSGEFIPPSRATTA